MAASTSSCSESLHKNFFKCCKNKEVNYFICVNCYSIYHKSCLMRMNKSLFTFITNNKIKCCEVTSDLNHHGEILNLSSYDDLITDLVKDNELKDKYILKLKHDNNSFSEEAVKNEEEMVKIIENQQKEIIELQKAVVSLKKVTNNIKIKETNNSYTQTVEKNCNIKKITTKKLGQNKPSDETIKNIKQNTNRTSTMNVGNDNLNTKLDKLNTLNVKKKDEIENLKIKNDNLVAKSKINKKNTRETMGSTIQTGNNIIQPNESQQPSRISKQYEKRNKILILCDQHGRNLNRNLSKHDSLNQFHVESFLKPGANYENVLNDVELLVKSYTKSDFVIVIAGSNDFQNLKYPKMKNICNKMKLCAHTNLIFLSTPKLSVNKNNRHINKFNNKLGEFLAKLNNYTEGLMSFIDINGKTGIKLGNFEICTKIAKVINSINSISKNLIFIDTNQTNQSEHERSLINISDITQCGSELSDNSVVTNFGANKDDKHKNLLSSGNIDHNDCNSDLISNKDHFLYPHLSQVDLTAE